jgi:hypothetical protein
MQLAEGETLAERIDRGSVPLERGAVMAADVSTTDGFSAGTPRRLFAGDYLSDPNGNATYDITADGRFLMISGERADFPTELKLIIGRDEVIKGMLE